MKKLHIFVVILAFTSLIAFIFLTHILDNDTPCQYKLSLDENIPENTIVEIMQNEYTKNGNEIVEKKDLNDKIRALGSNELVDAKIVHENKTERNVNLNVANNLTPIHEKNADQNEVEKTAMIDDQQAILLARQALGAIKYELTEKITIERYAGIIRVRFPVNKTSQQETRYRGPSFAAEVELDYKTGKVLKSRLGG